MTAATIASGIRLNDSCANFFEPVSASSDSTIYLNTAVSVNTNDVMNASGDTNTNKDRQQPIPPTGVRRGRHVTPVRDNTTTDAAASAAAAAAATANNNRSMSKKQRVAKKEYDRLRKRKVLFKKKCKITDISVCFALSGLLLMITETELTMAHVYAKDSVLSLIMKTSITVSTIFLLVLVSAYHALEVQLFMVDNGVEDWQIAVSADRAFKFCVEFMICSIHPMPFTHYVSYLLPSDDNDHHHHHPHLNGHRHALSLDLFLSLPMFMRLYLLCRVMLLHSRMFTDASSRSIGALNRIDINSRFVVKALMTICPGTVIITFVLTLFMIASWTVRACELGHDPERHSNILNSMWLISVTFLAVGYGDVVPQTYCGRAICVVSAMMGVSCTATMVAVLTRKLELTRAEKHVHNFVMDSQLNKRLRESAAVVLQETWRIYRLTKLSKAARASDIRRHQKRFLKAVHRLRELKIERSQLNDNANSMADLSRAVVNISDNLTQLKNQQALIHEDVRRLTDALSHIMLQQNSCLRTAENTVSGST